MKISVNEECILCGLCEDICPEVFEMGEEVAVVKLDPVPSEYREKCREAAEECPTEAIEIEEE